MRPRAEQGPTLDRRAVPAVGLVLLLAACSTSGKTPVAREVRDANGFTIIQEARVGPGTRGDFERALQLLERQQNQAGIALLESVTQAAPELTAAHINLAMVYGRVGDLERARVSLERALELNPRHPVAHNELGVVYRRSGRFDDARRSYEQALAIYPDFHFARRNLAILCDLFLADVDCALEHYERYAQVVPDDEQVAMWIADLRTRTGRQDAP